MTLRATKPKPLSIHIYPSPLSHRKILKHFVTIKAVPVCWKFFKLYRSIKIHFLSLLLSVKSIVDILPHRSTSFLEDILNKYTVKYTSMYRYIHIYYRFVTYKYSILPILYKYNKYIIAEQRTGLPRKGPVAILLSHLGNTGLDDRLSFKFYG